MNKILKISFTVILLSLSLSLISCKDEGNGKVIEISIISSDSIKEKYSEKLKAKVLYENGKELEENVTWTSLETESAIVNGQVLKALKTSDTLKIAAEKGGVTVYKDIKIVPSDNNVVISKKDNYYDVVIDYRNGASHKEIGAEYAVRIKEEIPDFEMILETYMMYNINMIRGNYSLKDAYKILMYRVEDIKPNVPLEYREELEGLASQFSAWGEDKYGDKKVSLNELYAYNLITDVLRPTQCSAVGVFGERAEDGNNIIGRNLDWDDGGLLCRIPSIVTMKNNEKSIVLIGYLAHMGALSVFNENKVFGAILDSPVGTAYKSYERRSYNMDLRYAIENFDTLEEVSNYMKDPDKKYTYSHLIFLADENKSAVVENNVSDTGDRLRELRESNSELHNGVTWGIDNALGVVNSFMLKGNYNNFEDDAVNTGRWATMKSELLSKGDKVSKEELKELISFDNGNGPGEWQSGDLYNNANLYTVIFQPETFYLEVAFKPMNGDDRLWDPLFDLIKVDFE